MGGLPLSLLLLSAIGTLAFIGYISFLWFANDSNETWKTIAIAGWTSSTIAIAAVVLRTSVAAQSGIASSMLASILLEEPGVYLPKLAVLSVMRAASPAPHALFWHTWSVTYVKNWLFTSVAAVLSITSIFLQFTSTVLLMDVGTDYIAG